MPLANITSNKSSTPKISSIASTSNINNINNNSLQPNDWVNHSVDIKIEQGNNLSVNLNEAKTHHFQQNLHLQQQQHSQQATIRHHHRIINNDNNEVLAKHKRLMKIDIGYFFNSINKFIYFFLINILI